MFKRRVPLTKLQLLQEIFWPSMGWRRAARYISHRVIRLADSPRRIAAGLAIGASISFSPLVGTHFIQAGSLAYLFRTNVIAALIATFVGNPWTFPFMWWGSIELGSKIFGIMGLPASTALPEHVNIHVMLDLLRHEPLRIFLPWMLGGYLLAVVSWPVFYVIFLNMVRAGKAAQHRAKLHKVHQAAQEITRAQKVESP